MIDFKQYLAVVNLFIQGKNPYNPDLILNFQKNFIDPSIHQPIICWTPPISIVIYLILFPPFISYKAIYFIWNALSLFLILLSISLYNDLLKNNKSLLEITKIKFNIYIAYFYATFLPVWMAIYYGQISPLLLLGISLYLYFDNKKDNCPYNSFIAGSCLSLTLIKPHYFLFLYIFIVIASILTKHFQTLLGFITSTIALSIIPWLINNKIYLYYMHLWNNPPIYWNNASLGSILQIITEKYNSIYFRTAPTIIAILIFIILFIKFFKKYNKLELCLYSLTVSILFAPYGWIYDYIYLLPPILYIFYKSSLLEFKKNSLIFIIANLGLFITISFKKSSFYILYYPLITLIMLTKKIKKIKIELRQLSIFFIC